MSEVIETEDNMVLKSVGRIWLPKTKMRGGARVYLPANIVVDSTFPFDDEGNIEVEIDTKEGVVKLRPIKKKPGKNGKPA